MALHIICAEADKGVAASLAGYLKTQNIKPVIERFKRGKFADVGHKKVILWSRHSTKSGAKFVTNLDDCIYVRLDKTPLPQSVADRLIVEAELIGHRAGRAWRDVARSVKYGRKLSVDGPELAKVVKAVGEGEICASPTASITNVSDDQSLVTGTKVFFLPILILVLLIAGLGLGVCLLHPESPYTLLKT
ncbi:hypothetical protein [Hirschia litorea]|uniref:Uncharacterized protein n=1 Tax=Hirschia litorea TaxID=1199156 RepID=A0ABW2IIH6_9PROT